MANLEPPQKTEPGSTQQQGAASRKPQAAPGPSSPASSTRAALFQEDALTTSMQWLHDRIEHTRGTVAGPAGAGGRVKES